MREVPMKAKRAAKNRNPIERACKADLRPLMMFNEPFLCGISLFGKPVRINGMVARKSKAEA